MIDGGGTCTLGLQGQGQLTDPEAHRESHDAVNKDIQAERFWTNAGA